MNINRQLWLTMTAAAVFAAVPMSAQAATYYWDENGATAGFGTAGSTWAAPTAGGAFGWSTDITGASVINSVTTTTGDSVYLGTDTNGLASGTITVSGSQNIAHLRFGKLSGAITLTGGTITFHNAGSWANLQAASGSGSAAATHTINSGLHKDNSAIHIGTQTTSGENYIINGVISGTAGLDLRPVNNGAYIAFNGTNTFSGNISHITGQVNVNNVADAGVACSMGTGSIYSMGGGGGQSPLLWYTGTSEASMNRTVRSTSTGDCRIIAQNGALDLTGSMTSQNTGSYYFKLSGTADTGTNTVSGVISDGSGTINVRVVRKTPIGGPTEDGYWRLTGVNTYTGGTLVNNSCILVIDGAGQLGSGSYAGSIDIDSSGIFDYSSTADQTLSGTISIDDSGTFKNSDSGNLTVTGIITGSGTGGVVKAGSGTMIIPLTNSVDYTGPTTVNAGTLQFKNTKDLAAISTKDFFINGGTLEFQSSVGGNNRTVLNNKVFTFGSSGGGTVNFNNGNHLFQGGGSKHTFTTTGGSQNFVSRSNGAFMNMQGSGTVTFNVADGTDDVDLEYSAHWNNGYLVKNGAGTMALTGAHSGAYGTTISNGTLLVNNTHANTVSVENGGTVGGSGTVSGLVTVESGGHISSAAAASTLTLSAGLTLQDGCVLDAEYNASGATGTIVIDSASTFTGAASANGVTVNVTSLGNAGGTFTLIDWTAATASGVDLSDFNIVYSGPEICSLELSGQKLLLKIAYSGSMFSFQ